MSRKYYVIGRNNELVRKSNVILTSKKEALQYVAYNNKPASVVEFSRPGNQRAFAYAFKSGNQWVNIACGMYDGWYATTTYFENSKLYSYSEMLNIMGRVRYNLKLAKLRAVPLYRVPVDL